MRLLNAHQPLRPKHHHRTYAVNVLAFFRSLPPEDNFAMGDAQSAPAKRNVTNTNFCKQKFSSNRTAQHRVLDILQTPQLHRGG
jgi:hypothetical protein